MQPRLVRHRQSRSDHPPVRDRQYDAAILAPVAPAVDDVAEAIARILLRAAAAGHRCYEFGGPRSYTYAELLRSVAVRIGTLPWLLPLSFTLWQAVAVLSEFVPGAPLTRSQVALMRRDNVASPELPGLRDLHVSPTALEDVVSTVADVDRTARR